MKTQHINEIREFVNLREQKLQEQKKKKALRQNLPLFLYKIFKLWK